MSGDGGVVLREAEESDAAALADLHVRTFRETHGGGPDVATREWQWRSKFRSGQLTFGWPDLDRLLLLCAGSPRRSGTG